MAAVWKRIAAAILVLGGVSAATLGAVEDFGPFATGDADPFSTDPERFTDFVQAFAVPQFDTMGGSRTLESITITYSMGLRFGGTATNNNPEPANATVKYDASCTLFGAGVSETIDINEFQNLPGIPGTSASLASVDRTVDVSRTFSVVDEVVSVAAADFGAWTGAGFVMVSVEAEGHVNVSGPGNFESAVYTLGSGSFVVRYTYSTTEPDCIPSEHEPNDTCEVYGSAGECAGNAVDVGACGDLIEGKLEKRFETLCEPDTFLVLFSKTGQIINRDDNGSDKGNGWASGLDDVRNYDGTPGPYGDGQDGLVANGDGTQSIRIGVTGRADGLDGDFNGFFQNAPHGQLGKFTVCVEFKNAEGNLLFPAVLPDGSHIANPLTYTDEFVTGAEAFHLNYTLPMGTVKVDVNLDNSVSCEEYRNDVDFYCLFGLVPLCDYCVVQVGGLNCECRPTATCLGWFDKSCDLIAFSAGKGPFIAEYSELCLVADVNGKAILAVSGAADCDFDGIHDENQGDPRAPTECREPTPGHGEAGCYTLRVLVTNPHGGTEVPPDSGASGEAAAVQAALDHGDLNMDGETNTADLGLLLGSFGWTSP